MKKVLLSAIAVMTFGISNAQEAQFGVKAGLNVATLTGDIEDAEALLGANVGVFAEIKLTDKFSFQPEVLFSMQGAKNKESESATINNVAYGYTSEGAIKLGYINIPLMAKYYVSEAFSLEVGPQVGFLISAKADYDETETFGGVTTSTSTSVDVKDELKGVDFGVNFGLGYNFTENLGVGVRYNLGLSNIAEVEEGNNNNDTYKINNSVVQLSLSYKF